MLRKNLLYERYLVTRLTQGDPDAFSEIFHAYFKDLVMFAFSIIKDMASSEEIVQDIFVKLWEDHPKLDVKNSLKSMLLKSVQNRCIDYHRHKKIIGSHTEYVLNNTSLLEYDTENYILWSELNGLIETAITVMPEKFREAYEMNRNKGLKYQEIATELAVSVRTVEVRISKALEFLRNQLKDFL
jgi:RNA polymerase sigma-70 factor (family 1)